MQLVVIPGDGIGPETMEVAVKALQAASSLAGAPLELVHDLAGHASLEKFGTTIREDLVEKISQSDGLILGPMTTHDLNSQDRKQANPSAFFRKHFDLFANVRPARTFEGVPVRSQPFDLVVVRENTEGFYADRNMKSGNSEILVTDDVVISMRRITRHCCERIARAAFELAMTRRRKVTIVHKSNVLKVGDGMFMDICHEVAREYPDVVVDDVIVDAMMALAVREPQRFDVLVTTNMFGDILSDLTAELSGSLGMAASINAGSTFAMSQAAHGSAPDIAGKNIANPLSQIWSSSMLLAWLAQKHQKPEYADLARRLELAMVQTVRQGRVTRDMGGSLGTLEVGDAVLENLNA
ncbi:isocitrate/isopropylmalate dehydrogenase family protein [Orrella marina]|uniref:3-isopropylmalate dehydrogenase n=1 Tax=Orrella marina TaxID=2163011 RepID=A0A2R4XN79_9BURK|nr:isocitrate/isopropylmalate dehydrogenase family protein [Orrella marina]AWB35262.1 3-isopropylmalate dehydrogenase [Orrella marina]